MPDEISRTIRLEPPADETTVTAAPGSVQTQLTARPGDRFGRYKILEEIGQGGCGAVFVAEQEEPVRRRVALKVIKLGMDTRQVIARFEAERQALAMMDHPNIARVLDAGATDTGRPFFVMELVRGIKITDYCDQNKLSTPDRLKLFIQVCQAIQHAHQKGIIHRDLKPSNILVTLHDGVPVPKVIDFGIAKATAGQKLTDKTIYTAFEQFIGTPAYMSPEQAEMSALDVDTRSDIYSLGVLLYELLIGETPFTSEELLGVGLDAMRHILREKDPARPSTRLSTKTHADLTAIALHRQSEPPQLINSVRGDLDWIVMKCLEKDRTRRYETANGLALDIERHLANEPVVARPPSNVYRLQKMVGRNKLAFAAAGAVAFALTAGLVVSIWMYLGERQAHEQAVAARNRALTAEREQSRLRAAAEQAQANEAKQKTAVQQELYDALVGQARATRLARQLGYRDRVFALLEQAKVLGVPQKNLADLRNEALACLGDFVGLAPTTFNNFSTNFYYDTTLAPSGKLAAFALSDGTIHLLETQSGKELAHLASTDTSGYFCRLRFNSTGDQLFALWLPTADSLAQYLQYLPRHRLYSWARDADGHWPETGNRSLPGVVYLETSGTDVFATIEDVGSFNSAGAEKSYTIRHRRFDVTTDAFAAGYDVTNIVADMAAWDIDQTPDGRLLAVETEGLQSSNSVFVLNLYDWKAGRRINELHLPRFGSVSLSSDGKYLFWFSVGENGGAIYAVPGLERIGNFNEYFTRPAAFSQNMAALPLIKQNRVRLWNLATREDVAMLDEPEPAFPMAFSSDGQSLLTISAQHARLYHLNTPEKLNLPSHVAAVPGIDFSSDGNWLASVGKDRVVRVCDVETGRILWQTNGLPAPGQCVSFSPDGRWLVTGDYETDLIEIWDVRTGRHLLQIETKLRGQTMSTQFSPDGRYLATIGNGTRIYKIADNGGNLKSTLVKSSPVGGQDLLFAPRGQSLVFRSDDSVFVWDFEESPQPHKFGLDLPVGVQMAGFTPDGHLLALDRNGRIVTLNLPATNEISSFQARKPADFTAGICLSPDGALLAVTSESQRGSDIWDFKTGKRLYSLPDEAGAVYWLAWSPDSRRLAVARDNGNIEIWNLDTVGQILLKLGLNP